GAAAEGLSRHVIQLVETSDRRAVKLLLELDDCIDLVMPRGGEGLIRSVMEVSRIPVLKHYKGVCHVFVDREADEEMALRICKNAKCQRPGVCNAMETLLVHRDIAPRFLPKLGELLKQRGVELRGDSTACGILPGIRAAADGDWTE